MSNQLFPVFGEFSIQIFSLFCLKFKHVFGNTDCQLFSLLGLYFSSNYVIFVSWCFYSFPSHWLPTIHTFGHNFDPNFFTSVITLESHSLIKLTVNCFHCWINFLTPSFPWLCLRFWSHVSVTLTVSFFHIFVNFWIIFFHFYVLIFDHIFLVTPTANYSHFWSQFILVWYFDKSFMLNQLFSL